MQSIFCIRYNTLIICKSYIANPETIFYNILPMNVKIFQYLKHLNPIHFVERLGLLKINKADIHFIPISTLLSNIVLITQTVQPQASFRNIFWIQIDSSPAIALFSLLFSLSRLLT